MVRYEKRCSKKLIDLGSGSICSLVVQHYEDGMKLSIFRHYFKMVADCDGIHLFDIYEKHALPWQQSKKGLDYRRCRQHG